MFMKKRGFTLIELLVVIAIIGLLSTLSVVALGTARERARDAVRLSDLRTISIALELYYNENSAYPTAATAVTLGAGNYACLNVSGWDATGCTTPYLESVPVDPGSNDYSYTSADGSTYTVDAALEGISGDLDGTIQLSPSGILDV